LLGPLAVCGVVLIAVGFTYFGGAGSGGRFGTGPGSLAGAPAASYVVARLGGGEDALDRHRGKVLIVNLWASWCGPCRSETPALERVYEEARARGLLVIGINEGESSERAGAFAREFGLQYPILLDEDQRYGRAYAALGLPTTLVVDRNGRIVSGHDGEMTLAEMRAAIAPLLRAQ